MTSEKSRNFAENLKNLRVALNLSYTEFSQALDIPKTTLQSIMEGGQTSLHTAMHISDKLDVPLDTLTNGCLSPQQIRQLDGFMSYLGWYDRLPEEKQKIAWYHVFSPLQLMQEGYDE